MLRPLRPLLPPGAALEALAAAGAGVVGGIAVDIAEQQLGEQPPDEAGWEKEEEEDKDEQGAAEGIKTEAGASPVAAAGGHADAPPLEIPRAIRQAAETRDVQPMHGACLTTSLAAPVAADRAGAHPSEQPAAAGVELRVGHAAPFPACQTADAPPEGPTSLWCLPGHGPRQQQLGAAAWHSSPAAAASGPGLVPGVPGPGAPASVLSLPPSADSFFSDQSLAPAPPSLGLPGAASRACVSVNASSGLAVAQGPLQSGNPRPFSQPPQQYHHHQQQYQQQQQLGLGRVPSAVGDDQPATCLTAVLPAQSSGAAAVEQGHIPAASFSVADLRVQPSVPYFRPADFNCPAPGPPNPGVGGPQPFEGYGWQQVSQQQVAHLLSPAPHLAAPDSAPPECSGTMKEESRMLLSGLDPARLSSTVGSA